jgi:hypothetical protein
VAGKAVAVVLNLFMALLSSRGISTPSLQAQGEQRRLPISTLAGTIPHASHFAIMYENVCALTGKLMGTHDDGYCSAWS